MSKRLVDIDDSALAAARAELGTRTVTDTINEALRRVVVGSRHDSVARALDALAEIPIFDRVEAWR